MPYMTTRTLIHTHAHLQHGTMTGHNVKTVTARPWPAVHTVHISLLISASHSIPSFSFLNKNCLQYNVLQGGKGVVLH